MGTKMELELEKHPTGYRVGSFVDNAIMIGGVLYTTSLIVTPEQVVRDWPPQNPDQLTNDDFTTILDLEPELILIGTGNELRFPDPVILKGIIRAGIGIDFMGSHAVCRTYNILAAEGRRVAAGIIINRTMKAR